MTFYREDLTVDVIIPELKAGSQQQALQIMADQVAGRTGLDARKLACRLAAWERKSVSSGIGGGVAIHHLPVKDLDEPFMLFARAPQMIDYNAVDGAPVDLIFLLLSPESDGPYHLQRLARISRMLRSEDLCNSLRGAHTSDALQMLLFDSTHRLMAA